MRWLRGLLVGLVVAAVVGYGFAWLTTDRFGASRAIAWLASDTGDVDRFPSRAVPAGRQVVELPAGQPLDLEALWPYGDPEELFERTGTVAFLVVQDGTLRYERYFGGGHPEQQRTSFSAVKSVVSTLVGLAIADGYIPSVDTAITDYIPELLERDTRFAAITIHDLLTMSSGLRYRERSLPWSDDTQTYYGTDLRRTALRTDVEEPPGRTFLYNNYNLLLEGLILERATGRQVSAYLSERLWQPMGAEADASWSLDSDHSGFEKMESGLNAIARDYARFGLLFAEGGRANGQQVVPADWIRYATARDTGTTPSYAAHWWTGDFNADPLPPGHFTAIGKYGQYVYVAPEQHVVIVRLGDRYGDVNWPRAFGELANRLK